MSQIHAPRPVKTRPKKQDAGEKTRKARSETLSLALTLVFEDTKNRETPRKKNTQASYIGRKTVEKGEPVFPFPDGMPVHIVNAQQVNNEGGGEPRCAELPRGRKRKLPLFKWPMQPARPSSRAHHLGKALKSESNESGNPQGK